MQRFPLHPGALSRICRNTRRPQWNAFVDLVIGGMMALSFISKLPEAKQQELLDDLNYLNISEVKSLCKRHSIPYRIGVETKDGRRRLTRDDDRKGVMLDRIRHFLKTGVILEETCFQAAVVPEWAFLSDRANKVAVPDWKNLRKQKASRVMKMLNQIPSG
jgi:hypothetical protein